MFAPVRQFQNYISIRKPGVDRALRWAIGVSLAVLIVHWAIIGAFVVPRLGTLHFLRLHYTARQGVDWVAEWYYLFLFPGFATLTFVLNTIVATFLGRRNHALGRMVMVATAFLEVVMAAGGVLAVLLNL